MKIRKHNVGSERWHLTVWAGATEGDAFKRWMIDRCPECLCAFRFNYGVEPHWEVRGTNEADMMMIMLVWGFSG